MFRLGDYKVLRGQNASQGIGIGTAYLYEEIHIEIPEEFVGSPDDALSRFQKSHEQAIKEVDAIYEKAKENLTQEEADIFGAHKMMLEDIEYVEAIENKIKEHLHPAKAVEEVKQYFMGIFQALDNDYFRERALDVTDISDRLIRIILDIKEKDLSHLPDQVIIVANDLTPSDTIRMEKEKVVGFIIERGGLTSHTAIIARTLGIPAVIGVQEAVNHIEDGQHLIVDGGDGVIILNGDEVARQHYGLLVKASHEEESMLQEYIGKQAESINHMTCSLYANIGSVDDVTAALNYDAQGIGLFRTEFIYMGREQAPKEEEQFLIYKEVAEQMSGKEVTIRTLDVGGDKQIGYLNIQQEHNPFLGYRAIRYCLDHEELFKTQLRAILRASVYGKILVMFPMITAFEELMNAKAILQEIKEDLDREGIAYDKTMKVGMMIETPASVMLADQFAKEVDFFSIGSNDLIQYTMVADRMNTQVERLYSPYYPAVIRAIHQVVKAAKPYDVSVSICGEVASDFKLTGLWLKMGINKLSMMSSVILRLKHHICHMNTEDVSLDQILQARTREEIIRLLDE